MASERFEATDALGSLGASAGAAIDALVVALRDPQLLVRLGAIKALGRIGSSAAAEAEPALLAAMDRPEQTVQAAWALGKLGASASAVLARLRGLLDDDDEEAREVAAMALWRIVRDLDAVHRIGDTLDSDDPKVWKPAFEKLLYFRPRIALDWQEQVNAVTTAQGRTALFKLWQTHTVAAPAILDADPGDTLGIVERGDHRQLKLKSPDPKGRGESVTIELKPMDEMFSFHWQRVRLAIIALERMRSDEAKAVLKQLADGHPDILPTKEAKAALERMK